MYANFIKKIMNINQIGRSDHIIVASYTDKKSENSSIWRKRKSEVNKHLNIS